MCFLLLLELACLRSNLYRLLILATGTSIWRRAHEPLHQICMEFNKKPLRPSVAECIFEWTMTVLKGTTFVIRKPAILVSYLATALVLAGQQGWLWWRLVMMLFTSKLSVPVMYLKQTPTFQGMAFQSRIEFVTCATHPPFDPLKEGTRSCFLCRVCESLSCCAHSC